MRNNVTRSQPSATLISSQARSETARSSGEFFESLEAGDDLVRHLEAEFHRELMDQAMVLVRPRVAAQTWDAFGPRALEGCSGATAAAQLQMKVARVYVAKSEVKAMIRDEIRKLEGSE